MDRRFDVIVMGGGAGGLFAAATAGQRGKRVLVLEHMGEVGKKILVSGGGRCNFTNLGASSDHYLSANPHFCKSALAGFTPADFLSRIQTHRIAYHEKSKGQLFCNGSARPIVRMLVDECRQAGVVIATGCTITAVRHSDQFEVDSSRGVDRAQAVIVATGGLAAPRLGATDLGFRLAQQFGMKIESTRPALVPLLLSGPERARCARLAGVSLDARVSVRSTSFRDRLLFTHRGLSGPAVLQASSWWTSGDLLTIDLVPDVDLAEWLGQRRSQGSRALPATLLADRVPARIADAWCARPFPRKPINQISDREIAQLSARLSHWRVVPSRTAGYGEAEVTAGGISTDDLESATLQARAVPGLFFIGELVDVTGWLGGFNLHWAWASAHAAGRAV